MSNFFIDFLKKNKNHIPNWVRALLPKNIQDEVWPPEPNPNPNPDPNTGENLDLSRVTKWLGANYGNAKETIKMSSAIIIQGDSRVNFKFDPYSWPLNDDGGCDAIACMFYIQGDGITGGKFDWIRKGGQTVKGLENVKGGYQGHSMPAHGTDSWFMFVSCDGKQRMNAVKAKWE